MQKNVAGQKWVVFAYQGEGGANPGAPVTGDAANITANLRLDGGAANAIDDTNPAELEDGLYAFDIAQAESNGDQISIAPVSATANVTVIGTPISLYTTPASFNSVALATAANLATVDAVVDSNASAIAALNDAPAVSAATITAAVWNEVLTGGTYNIVNSAGRRLRQIAGAAVFADGTAQSGTADTIQLESGQVTFDNQFQRAKVVTTGGTGVGQEAIITASVASTDTLTITPAWGVTVDETTTYDIVPGQAHSTVRNGGYDNGFVYFDSVNGSSGTQKGVAGTSTQPSDSMADVLTILAAENLHKVMVIPGSTVTLPATSTGIDFEGTQYNVALNSADIGASRFNGAQSITGIATASGAIPPAFVQCAIGTATLPPCTGLEVGFFGTLTIGTEGNYTFAQSTDVFGSSLVLDFGASRNASNFSLTNWMAGTVEIQNMGAGTGSYVFEMAGNGDLLINANCSPTSAIKLRGNIPYVNSSTIAASDIDDLGNITGTHKAALVTATGTATAGSTTTMALESVTNVRRNHVIHCTGGAGQGQSAVIDSISTLTATFKAQDIAFDDTSTYIVLAAPEASEVNLTPVDSGGIIVESNGNITLQQAISVILAAAAGVSASQETTSPTFSDPSGTSTRIAATTDANNDRTAITLTPSS